MVGDGGGKGVEDEVGGGRRTRIEVEVFMGFFSVDMRHFFVANGMRVALNVCLERDKKVGGHETLCGPAMRKEEEQEKEAGANGVQAKSVWWFFSSSSFFSFSSIFFFSFS